MDITDLKNGHVTPKFWVLKNLLLLKVTKKHSKKLESLPYSNFCLPSARSVLNGIYFSNILISRFFVLNWILPTLKDGDHVIPKFW